MRISDWRSDVCSSGLLLLWVSMPWVTRRLTRWQDFGRWTVGRWAGGALAVLAIVLVFASGWWITWTRWDRHGQVAQALPTPAVGIPVSAGDWRYYGRDPAGTRFTPLAHITPDHFGAPERRWGLHSGDLAPPGQDKGREEVNLVASEETGVGEKGL